MINGRFKVVCDGGVMGTYRHIKPLTSNCADTFREEFHALKKVAERLQAAKESTDAKGVSQCPLERNPP